MKHQLNVNQTSPHGWGLGTRLCCQFSLYMAKIANSCSQAVWKETNVFLSSHMPGNKAKSTLELVSGLGLKQTVSSSCPFLGKNKILTFQLSSQ